MLALLYSKTTLQGCDASLLILSTPGNQAEIEAGPNLTIHGQDLINTIKTQLEAACPGVVSCADIIALATREVVLLVQIYIPLPHQLARTLQELLIILPRLKR
jgi:peroxidase